MYLLLILSSVILPWLSILSWVLGFKHFREISDESAQAIQFCRQRQGLRWSWEVWVAKPGIPISTSYSGAEILGYSDSKADRRLIRVGVGLFAELAEADAETCGFSCLMVINEEINLILILTDLEFQQTIIKLPALSIFIVNINTNNHSNIQSVILFFNFN